MPMKFFVTVLFACALSACGTVTTRSAAEMWDAHLAKMGQCPTSMPEGAVETQTYRSSTVDTGKQLSSPVMQATAEQKRVESHYSVRCSVKRVKTPGGWVVVNTATSQAQPKRSSTQTQAQTEPVEADFPH
jgi:hypothetical protein